MKRFNIAIAAFFIFGLFSCGDNRVPENISAETKIGLYVIEVVDECEYIKYDHGIFDQRVYSLTHKGNCKFCAERSKTNKGH